MAHNFHDINGWLIVGLEMHQGFHIFPPAPMKFLKLVLLHPFTLGDKQKPTVLFNGVPSVAHQHEPKFLWPHLGIVPDPLDALTPLHILFGSHKCWLPRGAVEICGEKATCCVIGGPVSLNADCWDIGRWPTSLVLNPGTVQTTPTFGDFAMGAVTLAIDLVLDLLFEGAAKIAGGLLLKFGGKVLKPLFKKGKDLVGKGLRAATKQMGKAGKALGKGARALKGKAASALKNAKCFFTGHPVDATSGTVVDRKVDLSLPGAIPLLWERHYSSARALERTSLGRGGWTHSLEQWIEADEERITLRDEQGRDVYFPRIAAGESAFHRPDRLTLRAEQGGGFSVYNHASRLTRRFAPAAPQGRAWLRAIEDAHGNAITLEYAGERLHRVVDTAGREVRVKMSHGGRIARLEVWAEGILEQWVDYAYTKMGELASATDALGHAEHYGYDEDHRMVKTTLKNGVSFYYDYDPETGWCRKTWGDGGLHTVELRVDLEQRITWLTGNEEPRILRWNEDGIVVREETPDGIVLRTCEVDEDQYVVAEANGAGEATRYEYDARGNKIREIDPAGNVTQWELEDDLPVVCVGPDGLATRYEHDASGSLTGVVYPSRQRYALSYDERGHLRAIRGDEGVLVSFVVDRRHLVVEEVDARGSRKLYGYDRLGRVASRTDALGRTSRVTYDRLGRPLVVRYPDGTETQSGYDALGNLCRIVDALGQTTELEHAGTGVLTRFEQPDGRAWSFKYTAREKLQRITNPRDEAYEFTYDAAGRVTEERTFDGRVLRYSYSAGGRLTRIDYPDGGFRSFSHDPLGKVVREDATDGSIQFDRDSTGRLLGAAVEQGGERIVTRFERDALGRVVSETQGGGTLRYGYDALGRRVQRVMPDGVTTRYAYDALNDLVHVEHDGHGLVIERDALGREKSRGDAEGRVSIRSQYDAMDRIIEQRADVRAPGGGAPTAAVQRLWRYDPLGRVEQVRDGRWGATSYRHDAIGQLIEARRGSHRDVFEYDAAGAVSMMLEGLDQSAPDAQRATWEIGRGDLLLRTCRARYAYDGRGRRIMKVQQGEGQEPERTDYAWDCRDRLREVRLPSGERVVFSYDAFGRRTRKEVFDARGDRRREVRFLWDGDVLAADIDSEQGSRCFVHAPGTFVPLLQSERGEVFSYLNDHVGVPKELLDANGRVAWSAAHSAWGREIEAFAGPGREGEAGRGVASPFRLLGQYADEETGLCLTRFRYFDPEVGRWCSPDPLGLAGGGDPFGFNAAPTWAVDTLGLDPTPEQIDHAVKNIPGLTEDQARLIMNESFKRNSSAVFGGSRIRGNFRPDSDLDVGFGGLSKAQAGKVIDKANELGPLSIETTRIVPGNGTSNIPVIESPEEFFMREGVRSDPGRVGERFVPSGYIAYHPDGRIVDGRIRC
ncbi:DUF6531 domain-containing protein [Sorangium sp. So ce296]|uniref:DUF6531 domain-containing protein n=1 Tax=Sorangium sp. So ce296 TaxID=3133296 RepID=UPI003F5ED256